MGGLGCAFAQLECGPWWPRRALVTGLVWTAPAAAPALAASTINVPGDYATLQAAIDAAAAGDTIKVAAGTYAGHATVDKTLTIESTTGAAATTLDGVRRTGSPIIAATLESGETADGPRIPVPTRARHGSTIFGGALDAAPARAAPPVADERVRDNSVPTSAARSTPELERHGHDRCATRSRQNSANEGGAIWMSRRRPQRRRSSTTCSSTTRRRTTPAPSIYWSLECGDRRPACPVEHDHGPVRVRGLRRSRRRGAARWLRGAQQHRRRPQHLAPASSARSTTFHKPTFATNDVWNTETGGRYGGNCSVGDAPTDLNIDPVFADPDWDDVHLRADSPLIDAGTADAGVTMDIDGDSRPFDGDESGGAQIDIGADEATNPLLITPGSLWFEYTDIGWSKDLVLTLTNAGADPITITDAAISGASAARFSEVDDACAAEVLSVDESCTVTIRFTPTIATTEEAVLTVTGPGDVGTHVLHLSGERSSIPSTSPRTEFPDTAVGATSTGTLTVIVNLSETHSITLTGRGLTGDDPADFAFTSQACVGTTIPAGGTCDVPMSFMPHGKPGTARPGGARPSRARRPAADLRGRDGRRADDTSHLGDTDQARRLVRMELRQRPRAHRSRRQPAAPPGLRHRSHQRHVGEGLRPVCRHLLHAEHHGLHLDDAEADHVHQQARRPVRARGRGVARLRGLRDPDEDRELLRLGAAGAVRPGQHEPRPW